MLFFLQLMQSYVKDDCSLRCHCLGINYVECKSLVCGSNSVCDVRDGVRGCYCVDGYELLADGKTCQRKSVIRSVGTYNTILG